MHSPVFSFVILIGLLWEFMFPLVVNFWKSILPDILQTSVCVHQAKNEQRIKCINLHSEMFMYLHTSDSLPFPD